MSYNAVLLQQQVLTGVQTPFSKAKCNCGYWHLDPQEMASGLQWQKTQAELAEWLFNHHWYSSWKSLEAFKALYTGTTVTGTWRATKNFLWREVMRNLWCLGKPKQTNELTNPRLPENLSRAWPPWSIICFLFAGKVQWGLYSGPTFQCLGLKIQQWTCDTKALSPVEAEFRSKCKAQILLSLRQN